ncbi:MAG: hypothetical protein WCJ30_27815, partial [Deltaproteobacteria bacterium]
MSERASPDPELKEKLKQARVKLLFMYPFFGYLVTNLEDRIGERPAIQTAGTDGAVIHWNASFVARASGDDVMFVLAHEALHCALQHLWRRAGREERRWNVACDACVNEMLVQAGLRYSMPFVKGANGRSAEEVYEDVAGLLRANAPQDTIDDHSGWGEAKPGDTRERDKADAWKAALVQARSFGKAPAALSRHIDNLLYPKRDWRDLLREGLYFPEDYRWTPTDRRFADVLLPIAPF